MFSFFGQNKLIGLDIGTTSIKVAELDVGRKSASLVAFGMIPTPAQSYVEGDIVDTSAVSLAVREVITKIKSKRNKISVGMGGTSVIVKRITIPKMDEKLIAEQIRWEAEQYVPFDINEVNLGYEILKKTNPPEDSMDLLLVAAVQANVFKYAEVIARSGLKCSVVDVNGLALVNCFKRNYGAMDGQTIAMLNIGAGMTTMSVIESGETIFCRDIPVGGANYTSEIQKALNVSAQEAESIKLSASMGQTAPTEADQVIKATHDIVCEEIRSSIEFFLNTSRSQNVARCFVTGGGSKTKGLLDRVSQIIPCEKFDPFFSVTASSKLFSGQYVEQIRDFAAVAIGLGLREPGEE